MGSSSDYFVFKVGLLCLVWVSCSLKFGYLFLFFAVCLVALVVCQFKVVLRGL